MTQSVSLSIGFDDERGRVGKVEELEVVTDDDRDDESDDESDDDNCEDTAVRRENDAELDDEEDTVGAE